MRDLLEEAPGPAQRGSGLRRPEDAAAEFAAQGFRVVSIAVTKAPTGCVGSDWLIYRIEQGINVITGYRRGDPKTVRAEVDKIVEGLNERRRTLKKTTGFRPGRPSAAAAAARGQQGDDGHE